MQCDPHGGQTHGCQAVDRVGDAKGRILQLDAEAQDRTRRRTARWATLDASEAARAARLSDPVFLQERRRESCLAAWEHLRAAGLGSRVVDDTLRGLAS